MDRSRIGVVIPALNESATISAVVEAASTYGVTIVVNDGSSDNTAELGRRAGAEVVTHERNRGYDAAINSGFERAAAIGVEVIITLDGDGQHDSSIIQKFVAQIEAGADVVIGIRSRRQRFAEHLFAWYTTARFGIKDPLCGMKAYKMAVYREMGHFDSYGSVGTELMLFAAKRKYRIAQIPFNTRERVGLSRFGQRISGNYKLLRALVFSFLSDR